VRTHKPPSGAQCAPTNLRQVRSAHPTNLKILLIFHC